MGRPSPAKKSPAVSGPLAALARVVEATLPNGLKVRIVPNATVPTLSYYTFFRVGSRNERPGITGISHLFEHMMFNGAKRYGPGAFDKALESAGGTSNAYTSTDFTVYFEDCISEALETVIDLESDRMASLDLSPRLLERERAVVMEERRVRVENEIIGMMDEDLSTLVWKAHPYRWPVIGWMKDIERISAEDCREYFRTYYAPNNATIYVVGDVEPRATLELIRKYYGRIRPGPRPPQVLEAESDQRGERRSEIRYPAQAPALMIGFAGPPAESPDTLALDVIQYALSIGQGSRLVRGLVYERHLALSVSFDWTWRIDPGLLLFYVELKPDSRPAEVEAALYEELERLGREGLTERELQRAKHNLWAHLLRELSTNNGRANSLGTYEQLLGSWRRGLELPAKYAAVTAEQVRLAAARYFDRSRRSVVTLVPGGGEA